MFLVKLVDVADNKQVIQFKVPVETLVEAEILARQRIARILLTEDFTIEHDEELVYVIWLSDGTEAGLVAFQSL